ncbi:MAG: hypothetical protein JNL36_03260 [Candidatus Kapabacteria bacterium]|nr:hypothetical protein [Candidatus Kapabacteria bacterium]
MKKQLLFLSIILLVLVSCNDTLVEPKVPIEEDTTHKYPNCPLYPDINFTQRCDKIISVSYDGKYSSIEKATQGSGLLINRWILNNLTGEYILLGGNNRIIEFDSTVFTQFRYIGLKHFYEFNPYNSDIVVFTTFTLVDTIGDKKEFIGRDNLFTYNLQTKELKLITPSAFGKGGAIYLNNEGMRVKWLPESKPGNDVFFIQYNNSRNYKYYLQQDKLEELVLESYHAISNDLSIRFWAHTNFTNTQKKYLLNNKELYLFDTLEYRTSMLPIISFDNKYLLIQVASTFQDGVDTTQGFRHFELWIVEVENWLASTGEFKDFTKINTRFQHCMYLQPGNPVAFTPYNTIIASMHPYNNNQGNVYEMDLKGNIIRKITNN